MGKKITSTTENGVEVIFVLLYGVFSFLTLYAIQNRCKVVPWIAEQGRGQ